MAKNNNLTSAKKAKNDEFYTQYADIEKELQAYLDKNPNVFRNKIVLCPCDDPGWSNFTKWFAQNFKTIGLKKLISTSYNPGGKGKLFWIDRDIDGDGKIDINDLQSCELQGDGDFRSQEVTAIRDQADFIITNPPFSLFREFMDWIWKGPGLQFLVIGNMNAITYKEIFPKIKDNKMWWGATLHGVKCSFLIPDDYVGNNVFEENNVRYAKVNNAIWFTNIDHGRRHQPLQLMSIADNLKHSKHKSIKGKTFEEAYPKYDNYNAINVDFTDAIPKDYDGVMGVPISFLDKYCPEQFEIIWTTDRGGDGNLEFLKEPWNRYDAPVINSKGIYKRILIRKK